MSASAAPAPSSSAIGLIGFGAIGKAIWHSFGGDSGIIGPVLLRPESKRSVPAPLSRVDDVAALIAARPQLVVECAGHSGLIDHGARVLEAGIPLVVVSVGALADDELHARLDAAAAAGRTRYVTVAGAIGALDALAAAKPAGLSRVQYFGHKPPLAWKGTPAEHAFDLAAITEPTVIFEGSAREAALTYPKNANVTAAVALAGNGFDATRVSLLADPEAGGNMHRIEAEGSFGRLAFEIVNKPLPDNPKTSWLAALSASHAARQLLQQVRSTP